MEHHTEKLKKKAAFLNYSMRLQDGVPSEMEGDYRIGFRFMLPENLPGSLMYKNKKRHDAPHAKVKYFVKAKIVSVHDSMCMGHKAVLAVREKE